MVKRVNIKDNFFQMFQKPGYFKLHDVRTVEHYLTYQVINNNNNNILFSLVFYIFRKLKMKNN